MGRNYGILKIFSGESQWDLDKECKERERDCQNTSKVWDLNSLHNVETRKAEGGTVWKWESEFSFG